MPAPEAPVGVHGQVGEPAAETETAPAPEGQVPGAAETTRTTTETTDPTLQPTGTVQPQIQTAAMTTPVGPLTVTAATNGTVPLSGLALEIAASAKNGKSSFEIRLDPADLGRIDVRIDVDRNGQVTSHVTVDRADTLQLLQSQQPQLERALEQAGLKTADNGLQFTLRDQSFAGQNGGNGNSGNPSGTAQLVIPDADQPVIQATQIYSRAGLGSGVDIRV